MKVLARLSVVANYGPQTHVRAERKQADKKRATEDLLISVPAHDLPDIHPGQRENKRNHPRASDFDSQLPMDHEGCRQCKRTNERINA